MIKSFLAFYEQNGRLPVWNFYGSETDMMIGYHAVPVIVDAYLKGIGDFDAEKALKLVSLRRILMSIEVLAFISKRDIFLTMSQMNIIPRTGRCQEHWNMRSMIFV